MNGALPPRAAEAFVGAAIAFLFIVFALAAAYRRLNKRAETERADALLAQEIERTGSSAPGAAPPRHDP